MEFTRTKRNTIRNLPLTPLIDIVFLLIIFFMLTSTFMKIESLELIMPSRGGRAAEKQEVVRLYLHENGDMKLGNRKLDADQLDASLKAMFAKDAGTKMMVLTEEGVTMQQMVAAMDRVNLAGGQSIFVRKWARGK